MRPAIVILLAALGATAASAQNAPAPAPVKALDGESVVGCDTLVALRVLMAEARSDKAAARVSTRPDCRVIARDRIGAVEHRAMIGGTPFECIAVAQAASCAWIWP